MVPRARRVRSNSGQSHPVEVYLLELANLNPEEDFSTLYSNIQSIIKFSRPQSKRQPSLSTWSRCRKLGLLPYSKKENMVTLPTPPSNVSWMLSTTPRRIHRRWRKWRPFLGPLDSTSQLLRPEQRFFSFIRSSQ